MNEIKKWTYFWRKMALNSSAINKTTSKSRSNLVEFSAKTGVFSLKTTQFRPKSAPFATPFSPLRYGRDGEVGREVWSASQVLCSQMWRYGIQGEGEGHISRADTGPPVPRLTLA